MNSECKQKNKTKRERERERKVGFLAPETARKAILTYSWLTETLIALDSRQRGPQFLHPQYPKKGTRTRTPTSGLFSAAGTSWIAAISASAVPHIGAGVGEVGVLGGVCVCVCVCREGCVGRGGWAENEKYTVLRLSGVDAMGERAWLALKSGERVRCHEGVPNVKA